MSYDTETNTFTGIPAAQRTCWCGIVFAIPQSLNDYYVEQNRREPGSFALHCPLGHSMIPRRDTEVDKLKDQLAKSRAWADQAWAEAQRQSDEKRQVERRLRGTKAVVTRMKRRTVAGRCPCCSHQFADLKRHMKAQHPQWNPDRAADALAEKA